MAMLIVGSATLGLFLSNSQALVNQRLKAAKIVKQNIQNNEAGLTTLSLTQQMLAKDVSASSPSLSFSNILNPSGPSDLQFIALGTKNAIFSRADN
jgi:hypothetical protein